MGQGLSRIGGNRLAVWAPGVPRRLHAFSRTLCATCCSPPSGSQHLESSGPHEGTGIPAPTPPMSTVQAEASVSLVGESGSLSPDPEGRVGEPARPGSAHVLCSPCHSTYTVTQAPGEHSTVLGEMKPDRTADVGCEKRVFHVTGRRKMGFYFFILCNNF